MAGEPGRSGEYDPLDPANLEGFFTTTEGIRVTSVGDDGDILIMGHHDDDTAWRAFSAWRRYYDGETLSDEDREEYDVKQAQAAFTKHSEGCDLPGCTCYEDDVCKPCRDGKHSGCEGDVCVCADDYDHEKPDDWPCSCECYCDEYRWWVGSVQANGHPVTWVRWSWEKSKARAALIRPATTGGTDA